MRRGSCAHQAAVCSIVQRRARKPDAGLVALAMLGRERFLSFSIPFLCTLRSGVKLRTIALMGKEKLESFRDLTRCGHKRQRGEGRSEICFLRGQGAKARAGIALGLL